MVNVIGYVRVSSEIQVEGTSLDSQTEAILNYCKINSLNLIRIFREEGESGSLIDRTALQEMFVWLDNNKHLEIQQLVVLKLDRLARDITVHYEIFRRLATGKVVLSSIYEPMQDTPAGRFMMGLFALQAQYENEDRADKTQKGRNKNMELGNYMWKLPLGYQRVNHTIVRSEPDFSLIKEGFCMILYREKRLIDVWKFLNDNGVHGQQNKEYLAEQTVQKLYRNKLYTATYEHNSKVYNGNYESMITMEQFNETQYILDIWKERRVLNLKNANTQILVA